MAFITEWNMTAGNFTLPLRSGYTYNMVVDWGDGSPTQTIIAYNDPNATHNYTVAGTYQISLTGSCGAWDVSSLSSANKLKLIKVISWGDGSNFVITNSGGLFGGFSGARNLAELPTGAIKGASICTNITSLFENTGFSSVSADLFSLMPNVNNAKSLFFGNANLSSLPSGIFDYFNVTTSDFQNVCRNCVNLVSIPVALFRRYTASMVNFSYAFDGCPKLQLNQFIFYNEGEQSTRFLNKSLNLTNTFYRTTFTGVQGTAPDLWACNFGTGIITKTNCFAGIGNSTSSLSNYINIPTAWGAVHPKLNSISSAKLNSNSQKCTILCGDVKPAGDELICYGSISNVNLVSPDNILALTTLDNQTFEAILTSIPDDATYYFYVSYKVAGVEVENKSNSGKFYTLDQVSTTVINILPADYIVMAAPNQVAYTHGTIALNGFLYGTARDNSGKSIFKLNVSDYSQVSYNTFYQNKNTLTTQISVLEQIVFCSGFLWAISGNSGNLVRIDPVTLDYMIFNYSLYISHGEPIGTDGAYLYITTSTAVYKVDTSKLIGSFASYNYTGNAPVGVPPDANIGSCEIIQIVPATPAYLHSIITDANYLYLAITTSNVANGWVVASNLCHYHLQKINKHTMVTVGDVTIPRCTDDMTQNESYIFLAPEMVNTDLDLQGKDWGLIAIRKSTLQIKYLKALHGDFATVNEVDRQSLGVQYFGDYMAVQLVNSKKTVIISTSDINSWGANFPIGGATVAVYAFQFDGVASDVSCNEMSIDASGNMHANTWESNTRVFKFSTPEITLAYEPVVESVLISNLINQSTIGGYILSSGSSAITSEGFNYGTDPNNLTETITNAGTPIDFQAVLDELTPGIYFFRAYATNSVGTGYGRTIPFIVGNHLILSNDNDDAITNIRTNNWGFAVRCCKPAPGVADGVTGTVTDVDGNVYDTIVINEIEWITSDLAVTKYNNNDAIPNVTNAAQWAATTNGAYCTYLNV